MTGLLSHGRGLLVVDQAACRAVLSGWAGTSGARSDLAEDLRTVVLGTAGLERLVSGVLLDPAVVGAHIGRDATGGRRSVAVGVSMSEESIPAGVGDPTAVFSRSLGRYADLGARLAGWALTAREGESASVFQARARLAGRWAAGCQRSGLTPVIRYRAAVPDRARLEEAERLHRVAMSEVMTALRSADLDLDRVVLDISLVVPGPRASEVATAEDAAHATVRSLRGAGVADVAGLAIGASGPPLDLGGHLAAMQWTNARWPLGFSVDDSFLAPALALWAGRADRAHAAQHELSSRLASLVAVLRANLSERRGA